MVRHYVFLQYVFVQVISVEESKASMFGTKVEVVLRKAEPGSWTRIDRVGGGVDDASATKVAKNEGEVRKSMPKGKLLRPDFSPGIFFTAGY